METHATVRYNLEVFWDDEYKGLEYVSDPFKDPVNIEKWIAKGYSPKFAGDLADMRGRQPSWNQKIIDHFTALGWKDIGTAYYRMSSGVILPEHQDLYLKYRSIFNLEGKEQNIRRAIVFLEDWKPGHYLEVMGIPVVQWKAGQVVEWTYDTPHMAANMGWEDRYTLQVTGHL